MRGARGMRIENVHEGGKLPLVAQGRFDRTLFGLGLFTASSLFVCGIYLLGGAMLDLLGATVVAVLVAGFTLSLASFLVGFLVWSRGKELLARRREAKWEAVYAPGPVLTVFGQTVRDESEIKPPAIEPKALPEPVPQAWAARAGK